MSCWRNVLWTVNILLILLFVSFFFVIIFFISFVSCAVYSHTTCLVHPSTSQMVSKTEHSLSVSFFFSVRNLRLWYSKVFSVTWPIINFFFHFRYVILMALSWLFFVPVRSLRIFSFYAQVMFSLYSLLLSAHSLLF